MTRAFAALGNGLESFARAKGTIESAELRMDLAR